MILPVANLLSADTVCLSLLQESPSLWHFMTTRHGQETTSASRKEKGSRLSTARKSLQLLIRLPALGRNASFPFYHCLQGVGAAGSGADRALNFSTAARTWGNKSFGFIIWSELEPKINLQSSIFSLWKSCSAGATNLTVYLRFTQGGAESPASSDECGVPSGFHLSLDGKCPVSLWV